MQEEYQIAFGVDANYVKYAGVMMTSIVLNQPGQNICFHLLCDGLHPSDKQKLDQFTMLYRNIRLVVYDVRGLLDFLPEQAGTTPKRLNKTVFLRIALADVLPKELDKVLYMDADMLCIGDIGDLWRTDTNDKALAAAYYADPQEFISRIGSNSAIYFNAGVMVLNLPVWRRDNLSKQVFATYIKHHQDFIMLEQDTLNYLLRGNIVELPQKYNHMLHAFNHLHGKINPEDVILHFANEGKPWYRYCSEHIEKLYWSYVRRSLWFETEPSEPWDVKTAYWAGQNARGRGDYETASKYLGMSAQALLEYYLEHTGQLKK